ncbi:AfsR/SARP family transcriptional regulator [Streptomyces tsukubensis]
MNIQLLGCVEAHTPAGDRIVLPESARHFLASLAWRPNHFVTDETMAERLWDHEAPQHPRQTLYVHATRLRKALGCGAEPADGIAVVRRRGGYLLAVAHETVDLHRFRTSVLRAKDAERAGDPDRALRHFDEALSLWRGDPLSDLNSSWARSVRVTLRHEHRAVLTGRAELGMRAGRHAEHLPALQQLALSHPLDERVAGLLMLALYRSGRQAEALDHFQLVRSRMVARLGDGPGPSLAELHGRILRRDPRLDHLAEGPGRRSFGTHAVGHPAAFTRDPDGACSHRTPQSA